MANHPPPLCIFKKKVQSEQKTQMGGINLEDYTLNQYPYSETTSIEWTHICFEISNSKKPRTV